METRISPMFDFDGSNIGLIVFNHPSCCDEHILPLSMNDKSPLLQKNWSFKLFFPIGL